MRNFDGLCSIYILFFRGAQKCLFLFSYYTMYGYDLSNGKIMIPMALNLFILNDAKK